MPLELNARRRWFGLLYLITSGGMVIWGLTLLEPVLRGGWFVGYWTVCAALALLALGIGWLDWRSLRRQLRAERRAHLHRVLEGVPSPKTPSPPPRPAPPPRSPPPTVP